MPGWSLRYYKFLPYILNHFFREYGKKSIYIPDIKIHKCFFNKFFIAYVLIVRITIPECLYASKLPDKLPLNYFGTVPVFPPHLPYDPVTTHFEHLYTAFQFEIILKKSLLINSCCGSIPEFLCQPRLLTSFSIA